MWAREDKDSDVFNCRQCANREYEYTDETGRTWQICYRDVCDFKMKEAKP